MDAKLSICLIVQGDIVVLHVLNTVSVLVDHGLVLQSEAQDSMALYVF